MGEMLRGDMNWFGTMMMYMGQADGMVSGAAHATADTMRPALQVIKAVPEVSLVSSVFFMLLQDGAKVFADCGLVVNPNSKELAEILRCQQKLAALSTFHRELLCAHT